MGLYVHFYHKAIRISNRFFVLREVGKKARLPPHFDFPIMRLSADRARLQSITPPQARSFGSPLIARGNKSMEDLIMMKKRVVPLLMTASLLTASLTGCSSQTAPSESGSAAAPAQESSRSAVEDSASVTGAGEKVLLHYYAWSEGDYLQEIVDAYNAQSQTARVEMTQVNSSDYEDKLFTMLAGKNDIDIFNIRTGSLVSDLAGTGNLVDLSTYIQDSGLDVSIYGTGFAETKIDDKFYALPYRSSAYGLFYNKKIFDEKGIPYPDNLTWDEYADLALELTEGEGTGRFYGSYIPDWNGCPYEVIQKGSNLADDDLTPARIWAERLNRFYNTDNSHMSFTDMKSTGTDAINFFGTGGCAMYPGGEWSISDVLTLLKNNPQLKDTFELGIATVPQVSHDAAKVTIGGVSTFIGISASSPNQAAAYDFLQFISGKEAAKIIAASGAIPAWIDDEITAVFEDTIGVDGASNMLSLNKISESLFIPEYTDIINTFKEELELYLIGEQSIDDMMENFEQRRAEIAQK